MSEDKTIIQQRYDYRYTNMSMAVTVPLIQSVITGAMAGIIALSGASMLKLQNVWGWGFMAGAIVTVSSWLYCVASWRRIVYQTEQLSGIDINQDGYIGNPDQAKPEPMARIEIKSDDGRAAQWLNLPASYDQVKALADGISKGITLSESNWTGTGRLFERSQFANLRAELIKRGLCVWNNPRTPARGIALTRAGQAAFSYLANHPTTSDYNQ